MRFRFYLQAVVFCVIAIGLLFACLWRMATQPTNLTMHRAGPSVWDRQVRENSQCRAMGAIGLLMIAGGICFVAQAYKGQLATVFKGRVKPLFAGRHLDHVNKAADDSFPASDPPSWTPAVGRPGEAGNTA